MSAAYCLAAPSHPLHGPYHGQEYGFPADDESVLFERLVLEINQAGLSWLTVLKKREAFRAAFADFEVDRIAAFDDAELTGRVKLGVVAIVMVLLIVATTTPPVVMASALLCPVKLSGSFMTTWEVPAPTLMTKMTCSFCGELPSWWRWRWKMQRRGPLFWRRRNGWRCCWRLAQR